MSAPRLTLLLVLALAGVGCGREFYVTVDDASAGLADAALDAPGLDVGGGDAAAARDVGVVADCACDGTASFDLVASFLGSTLPGAGPGMAATQPAIGGFTFAYQPATRFSSYGPLVGADADPSSYVPMEMARAQDWLGWYANSGLQIGQRCIVSATLWDVGWIATSGDALAVLPENNAQPIVAWHAPWAGLATISLDTFVANGDVEVHLLAEVGGAVEEIATRYLGLEAVPDAYGQVPEARSGADPLRLTASRAMSAGDAYFLYARVGDDDSNDVLIVRGSVGIAPGM